MTQVQFLNQVDLVRNISLCLLLVILTLLTIFSMFLLNIEEAEASTQQPEDEQLAAQTLEAPSSAEAKGSTSWAVGTVAFLLLISHLLIESAPHQLKSKWMNDASLLEIEFCPSKAQKTSDGFIVTDDKERRFLVPYRVSEQIVLSNSNCTVWCKRNDSGDYEVWDLYGFGNQSPSGFGSHPHL